MVSLQLSSPQALLVGIENNSHLKDNNLASFSNVKHGVAM